MKLFLVCLFLLPRAFLSGVDWPNFGGPHRNHQTEEKIRLNWDDCDPEILWKINVGLGYSSVIEAKGMAYTQGYKNNQNTLFCVDAENGEVLWTFSYQSILGDKYFQGGSRSTPTFYDQKIYLLGHEGPLFCLEAKTGKVIWQKHLVNDFGGRCPTWGYAGAPLVVNGRVVLQTGAENGSLLALDAQTGNKLWSGGTAEAGYATPFLRKLHPSQIVVFNQSGLSIHDLVTGGEKLTYGHRTRYEVNAAQPLDLGKQVLVASGYGKGAAMLELESGHPRVIWESDSVGCQMASLVSEDGYAYGINGQTGANASRATLFCLELTEGRKIWEKRGYGVGTLILIDNTIAVLSDRGELSLVNASPSGFNEMASFQVLGGKSNWTPPTYANGRMHCRSSTGEWVCLFMQN
jgi:outer membrane protein assembly factor BamB